VVCSVGVLLPVRAGAEMPSKESGPRAGVSVEDGLPSDGLHPLLQRTMDARNRRILARVRVMEECAKDL